MQNRQNMQIGSKCFQRSCLLYVVIHLQLAVGREKV